jgi:YfiH family protein
VIWERRGAGCGARVSFSGRAVACALPRPASGGLPVAAGGGRQEVYAYLAGEARPVAWARQVHGARVVLAGAPGDCGEGDGLVARDRGVALAIVTADCVPVLLAGPQGIAAAHAGWRGIVAGVVPATVAALGGSPADCVAWIGPAIGPCCYETGPEVAEQLAAASHAAVVSRRPSGRPGVALVALVDLRGAVRHQLEAAGVRRIEGVSLCTRCAADRLYSYRREGKGGGRNHAFIWLA